MAPNQALERAVTPALHLRWSLRARRSAPSVSAALRAALTTELASPTGSARPDLFFGKRKK